MEFLEFEERIGHLWHRLVGKSNSYPHYPQAAVSLDAVHTALTVYFRGLGGTPGISLTAGAHQSSKHRLKWMQRLGMEHESMPLIEGDTERILLPATIACFPDRKLNRRLYYWLAAFFALSKKLHNSPDGLPNDPLQADLVFLHHAYHTAQNVCNHFPGLANDYQQLCQALCAQRPRRHSLPEQEQAVEAVILTLLGQPHSTTLSNAFLQTITQTTPDFQQWQATAQYHTFLPIPLWGQIRLRDAATQNKPDTPDQDSGDSHEAQENHKKQGRREKFEQSERDDPLLLNRFEKLFSWSEMLNINRAVQDDDEKAAKEAAQAMEEIALSEHQQTAATKLKLDLDLAPGDAHPALLIDEQTYPEWDYRRKDYHANQCRVIFQQAEENGELWEPDLQARRRFRKIRRQFEALRPKREILRNQLDGVEFDMDAVIRTQCDLLANGHCSDRVYQKTYHQNRELAVTILVDVSLSTDSWVNGLRTIDVEKEALVTLATGLAACRDAFAIYTFTSRNRHFVRIAAVKDFNETFNERTLRRIAALRPGYYTRMGTAIRHTKEQLVKRTERHRLILLLSDGKPNDLDYYEGRYGIEDTRQAILEARQAGLLVFGITIDRKARDYFPYLFGRGHYAIVGRPDRLSQVLPIIYQQLIN